jgi:DNA-binding MarR family transcriptional regulator
MSAASLNPLIDIINVARSHSPSMTLNQLVCLLHVMRDDGTTQTDIMRKTGLTDASASRIVGILSHRGNRGTDALNLVRYEEDPNDFRRRLIHLTPTGVNLRSVFVELLGRLGRNDRSTQG